MKQRVLVWDIPTRLFHWAFAFSFAGAYLTAESERWRDIHVMLGYSMLGLIAFRVLWGFIGSRHARFADFVRGPRQVVRYLYSLLVRRPIHYLGHNPAGAMAILLLIGLAFVTCVSGWLLYEEIGGEWFEEMHEVAANAMLVVVALHVLAVAISSRLHGENLVLAMITGYKTGRKARGISGGRPVTALLLLATLIGAWGWSMRSGPIDMSAAESIGEWAVSSCGDEERD